MRYGKSDSPQFALNRLNPNRITFARELRGLTKKDLAEKISKTPSAISQIERGQIRPDLETFIRMSIALNVPPSFFADNPRSLMSEFAPCHFRSLRSTSQALRRQSIRKGALFISFVDLLESKGVLFPKEEISNFNGSSDTEEDIEQAAISLRHHWKLGLGPIPNIVRLVESKGIIVLPLADACIKVDAYSTWHDRRPCIMLSLTKTPSRVRFDVGHELGHIALHEETAIGESRAERQADRFAGAFLAPRDSFLEECPRRWSFHAFYQLKYRWRMSIQALLYRAKDLGCLSPSTYQRAMIQLTRDNMRKDEGREWSMEKPVIVAQALELLKDRVTLGELADELSLYPNELRQMLNLCVPEMILKSIDMEEKSDSASIVQLSRT